MVSCVIIVLNIRQREMQDEVDGTFVLHVINELFQVPTLFPISFASKIMFECYRK